MAYKLTLAALETKILFLKKEERYGLTSQARRAALMAANLAKGCGRRSDDEMARLVQIAMGSRAEVSYHFLPAIARDLSLMQAAEYHVANADVDEIMLMLSALPGKPRDPRGAWAFRARS